LLEKEKDIRAKVEKSANITLADVSELCSLLNHFSSHETFPSTLTSLLVHDLII
jgi:hypothetical protein